LTEYHLFAKAAERNIASKGETFEGREILSGEKKAIGVYVAFLATIE